jgi:hypothetical protein
MNANLRFSSASFSTFFRHPLAVLADVLLCCP